MTGNGSGQSGGVSITGGTVTATNIAGRDINVGAPSPAAIEQELAPLAAAVAAAPPESRAKAEAMLDKLKAEAMKGGNGADDGVLARLVDGLVGLVPAAASAVGTIFAGPLLGAMVGPVTKFVLSRIGG